MEPIGFGLENARSNLRPNTFRSSGALQSKTGHVCLSNIDKKIRNYPIETTFWFESVEFL